MGKNNEYLYSYQLFELGTKDTLAILLYFSMLNEVLYLQTLLATRHCLLGKMKTLYRKLDA